MRARWSFSLTHRATEPKPWLADLRSELRVAVAAMRSPTVDEVRLLRLSFRTSRRSFLPPPFGVLGGLDREGFEFADEVVEALVVR